MRTNWQLGGKGSLSNLSVKMRKTAIASVALKLETWWNCVVQQYIVGSLRASVWGPRFGAPRCTPRLRPRCRWVFLSHLEDGFITEIYRCSRPWDSSQSPWCRQHSCQQCRLEFDVWIGRHRSSCSRSSRTTTSMYHSQQHPRLERPHSVHDGTKNHRKY